MTDKQSKPMILLWQFRLVSQRLELLEYHNESISNDPLDNFKTISCFYPCKIYHVHLICNKALSNKHYKTESECAINFFNCDFMCYIKFSIIQPFHLKHVQIDSKLQRPINIGFLFLSLLLFHVFFGNDQ